MFKSGDRIAYLRKTLNVLNNNLFYEQYRIKDLNNIKSYYTFDHYNGSDKTKTIIYLKDFPLGHCFNVNDFSPLKENRKLKLKRLYEKRNRSISY
jgi:hypothetical protein